jgi:hypothetical protein
MDKQDCIEIRKVQALQGERSLTLVCDRIGCKKGRFFEMPSRQESTYCREGESIEMGQRHNSIEKLQEEGQQYQPGNQDPQRRPHTDGHIPVGQQENLADSEKLEQNVGPDIQAQTQVQALKNLDAVTQQVKQEFREWKLVKRRDLVTRLGNAFERVCPSNPETVCEEIKNALRDEIAERLISTRDI